jgi:hypothetical protein
MAWQVETRLGLGTTSILYAVALIMAPWTAAFHVCWFRVAFSYFQSPSPTVSRIQPSGRQALPGYRLD